MKKIKNIISTEYGIPDISCKSRKSNIVEARAVFCWVANRILDKPIKEISEYLAFDYHTVTHHIKRVSKQKQYDMNFSNRLKKIVDALKKIA